MNSPLVSVSDHLYDLKSRLLIDRVGTDDQEDRGLTVMEAVVDPVDVSPRPAEDGMRRLRLRVERPGVVTPEDAERDDWTNSDGIFSPVVDRWRRPRSEAAPRRPRTSHTCPG